MKRYYVDLRPLPLSERTAAVHRMDGWAFLTSEVFESGAVVGAYVFLDREADPLPPGILPAGCSLTPA